MPFYIAALQTLLVASCPPPPPPPHPQCHGGTFSVCKGVRSFVSQGVSRTTLVATQPSYSRVTAESRQGPQDGPFYVPRFFFSGESGLNHPGNTRVDIDPQMVERPMAPYPHDPSAWVLPRNVAFHVFWAIFDALMPPCCWKSGMFLHDKGGVSCNSLCQVSKRGQ